MRIIGIEEKEEWNRFIKSFAKWDIYYLHEYAKSLELHGDGTPQLICYETDNCKVGYVMMLNDIASLTAFAGHLKEGIYYDFTTPYGYGGPLVEGDFSDSEKRKFLEELSTYCKNKGIVSQFFRFHPLLGNQVTMEGIADVVTMKQTVYIDTADKETIFRNMTPNCRNMIRKAERNGIRIVADHGEGLDDFLEIYEVTMKKNQAEDYYYFERAYFEYLIEHMRDNMIFLYAQYEGKVISASIFFYNEWYMHYHLSGTLPEYNKLGATNLLLGKAADFAAERGIAYFHLGGGVSDADSLLSFKKHFNRNGLIDFYIGRNIFDEECFHELVAKRKELDESFDLDRKFMIKYRM